MKRSALAAMAALGLLLPVVGEAAVVNIVDGLTSTADGTTFTNFDFTAFDPAGYAGVIDFTLSGSIAFSDGTELDGGAVNGDFSGAIIGGSGTEFRLTSGTTTFVPGSDSFVSFSISGTFDCATIGGCESIGIGYRFDASGDSPVGDVFGITARFEANPAPVPVPAALPLFISGLAGLAILTRRRAA